eukprot:CAMPEP_0183515176 /NCGR_PEP_ID=MMETSP0371-20130417/13357_1 /TAXON_ID=268820 /ORGANISM="Peridinium aciculiferum, Strain PAER-2" /LENGTH=208 /DNA_ID=CAMNT_0025712687 /DNA_START=80 /DNA_END=706 /DNA_ORIENTATION=-
MEYWDEQYATGHYGDNYEWYDLSWADLRSYLSAVLPRPGAPRLDILVSGCGNSPISVDIAKEDFVRRMVNVDISSVVIESMRSKHPSLEWAVSDARELKEFDDHSFDLVFDKGTLDALRGSNNATNSELLFAAYRRVVRPGGVVIIVTSCGEEECMPLLKSAFDKVGQAVVPKKNLEELSRKAKRYKFEIRTHDTIYFGSMDVPKAEL